jgi:hypothetical protein
VADAEYFSVSKEQCYETTRTGIQDSIMELLNHRNGRFVWLQGSPGTGKTAIAKSIADSLAQDKCLAASFFWDKTGGRAGSDSIELFPSTLASQLATFSPDYEMLLVNCLLDRSSRNILRLPLEKRIDSLVIQPMGLISQVFSSAEHRPVIVLDGLDECGSRHALAKLMKLVVLLDKLPPDFVIFVSARPEPEIRAIFEPSPNIPRVYTDDISEDDTNHTIMVMVQHGLAEICQPHHSDWLPSKDDWRAFMGTCRQLPVLADIRIREVNILASSGHTLRDAFRIVKDDGALSRDLNDDYLRILQRAYRRDVAPSASHSRQAATQNSELDVSPCVLHTYREVVGTVIAARKPLSVQTMSKILAISEETIHAVLYPIGSIINAPASGGAPVYFYHATAKEFLTGPPHGDKNDRGFFFSDVKGAFLALPLLKTLNFGDNLKRDMKNTMQSSFPGEPKVPEHVAYAAGYWSTHLDLSSASEELWGQLRLFLTTKLLFWLELEMSHESVLDVVLKEQKVSTPAASLRRLHDEFQTSGTQRFVGINADLPRLLNDAIAIARDYRLSPRKATWEHGQMYFLPHARHIYRSIVPFLPLSSPVLAYYNKLLDPIRVLRVDGGNYKPAVPSNVTPQSDTPIACATLSDDGCRVALGFRDGVVEVVDTELGVKISRFADGPPNPSVWLLFTNGGHNLVTENSKGDVYILDTITSRRVPFASRFDGASNVVASLSHDNSMIVRVAHHVGTAWYENISVIHTSMGDPTINTLAPPFLGSQVFERTSIGSTRPLPSRNSPFSSNNKGPGFPFRRSVGFSLDGQYIAAFDAQHAFI